MESPTLGSTTLASSTLAELDRPGDLIISNPVYVARFLDAEMARGCPKWTVEQLLTHPLDAAQIAIETAFKVGQISEVEANDFLTALAACQRKEPAVNAINRVCKVALSQRGQ